VNTTLKQIGMELKSTRTDGVYTIKRISDNKVVAAIHPITRKFWVKKRSRQGKNCDFQIKPNPVNTFDDLIRWGREALEY
jgi:hypothetical protein